tara:strand:+ start:21 stop:971 length:951 start_codon:yes stop_codon:yes gene_type:complete
MSKDKNELNEASNNLSNEKKLDATDESKPKKLESEIKNDKKDTLSPESKKSASNSNNKDPKPRDGEKKLSPSDQEKTKINQKNTQIDTENQVEQDSTVKNTGNKGSKTLTGSVNKTKKVNNLENKQNNAKFNNSESNNKVNEQPEYIEKLVSINRVAKVVKGGRRFSFAALVVVGDGNGMVGHGKGKAKEVPEAIKKATDEAKTRMIRVPLRQGRTLHHDIRGRFDSGKVYLRSAPSGTGVIAGGPMRAVFEALGIQDIVAKSVGTSNPHNMVRATFEALKVASSPKIIAARRGLKINEITKRRKVSQGGVEDAKN